MNYENLGYITGLLSLIFIICGWAIYLLLIYSKKISGSTWGWLTNSITNFGLSLVQITADQIMVASMFMVTAFFSLIAAINSNGWKTRKITDWYKTIPSCAFISLALLNPIYSVVALGANIFWVNWLFIKDIKNGNTQEKPIIWALWSIATIMALLSSYIEVYNGAQWYGIILPLLVAFWVNTITYKVFTVEREHTYPKAVA